MAPSRLAGTSYTIAEGEPALTASSRRTVFRKSTHGMAGLFNMTPECLTVKRHALPETHMHDG